MLLKNELFSYACFLYKSYRQTAALTNKFQVSALNIIIWVNAMLGYAFLQCKTISSFSQHKNLLFRYACFLYKCYRQTAVFTNKFQISCNYLGQCYGGLCFFTVQILWANKFYIQLAQKSSFQVCLFPVQMLQTNSCFYQ